MNDVTYPSISILGSTGSVGRQAIDVALQNGIRVNCLSANRNVDLIEHQARTLGVSACAMADREAAKELKRRLFGTSIEVYVGADGICEMVSQKYASREIVLNAIIGASGLRPTLAILSAGKKLAVANKESLVCAGDFVMQLADVTPERALAHPTWNMGAKITVDSATLMNKGFEVIEAAHLFGVSPNQIEVLVHRESIMHSAVEYIDNSVIAQMSVPDMRHCVQYALTHPARQTASIEPLDFTKVGAMTFAKPDTETFVLLDLAKEAIRRGGAYPAILNAANEVAVAAFLEKKLSFTGIFDVVSDTFEAISDAARIWSVDDIFAFDGAARSLANEFLEKRNNL